jgi:hypothetical protein
LRDRQRNQGDPGRGEGPGNRGTHSADDHIKVFTHAIEQLPDDFCDDEG